MLLVLGLIGPDRFGDDLPRDPVILDVRVPAGVRVDLRAIDSDHPRAHQPRLLTQPQHRTKQSGQRRLVTAHEPRDRRVIRHLVSGNHPIGNVLTAVTLDPPRGTLLRRIREQHQGHHHRRVIRRAAMPVRSIRRIERRQIQPLDALDHEPRQMILRQPIPQRRRHQKRLLTIKTDEVLRHSPLRVIAHQRRNVGGAGIRIEPAIAVGNIFKLGTRYSEPLDLVAAGARSVRCQLVVLGKEGSNDRAPAGAELAVQVSRGREGRSVPLEGAAGAEAERWRDLPWRSAAPA
jgi:hypothetical protein